MVTEVYILEKIFLNVNKKEEHLYRNSFVALIVPYFEHAKNLRLGWRSFFLIMLKAIGNVS